MFLLKTGVSHKNLQFFLFVFFEMKLNLRHFELNNGYQGEK